MEDATAELSIIWRTHLQYLLVKFAIGVFSTISAACSLPDSECIDLQHQVTLRGKVSQRQVYGPPNFGETPAIDQRRVVRIFTPHRPVRICDTRGDVADRHEDPSVTEMQLINDEGGHTVENERSVTGVLARSENALHYTPVIFIVS